MKSRIEQVEHLAVALMKQQGLAPPHAEAYQEGSAETALLNRSGLPKGLEDDWHEGWGAEDDADFDRPRLDPDEEALSRDFGRINMDQSSTSYRSGAHWATILEHITEVKGFFESTTPLNEGPDESEVRSGPPSPILLLGASEPPSKTDILASMPEKTVVDRLVSRYFNSKDLAVVMLHVPTFQQQYEAFWEDPDGTSVAWIGLLFSIMCLATFFYRRTGDPLPEPLERAHEVMDAFRVCTAHCLFLGNYTKPGPHTLETLLLHLFSEYVRSNDAESGIYVMMGIIVRLALRMGLHRDPAQYSKISPFQGEMRRRLWAMVSQTDLLISFQSGFPSTIRQEQGDTEPPSNLFDEDFDEDSKDLPPSRPRTEMTPVSYLITKSALTAAFRRIAEHAFSMDRTSYETVLKLDHDLQAAQESIPAFLQIRSMDRSITDPAYLIMQRFYLELLFQKSRCVLHRRYMLEGRRQSRFAYSRATCIEAALKLLEHQSAIHNEIQRGGQLYRDQWFVSSLTSHDFLTAAMILCLEVSRDGAEKGEGSWRPYEAGGRSTEDEGRRKLLIKALERSREIWQASKDYSREARKAYEALKVMLYKVNDGERGSTASSTPSIRPDGSLSRLRDTTPAALSRGEQPGWEALCATETADAPDEASYESMTIEDMLDFPGNDGVDWVRPFP
ncbi:MAG: hypothetical protein M1838_004358 [Thelocarpon superellum]|nr:MAG: hypothetical protein M1838_004358 [Thelocarpon superellum]